MDNNETPLRTSQNFLLDSDALTKLQNNDPSLTSLTVGLEAHVFNMAYTDGFLPYHSDWGKCGQLIGRNTNIIELSFGQLNGIPYSSNREIDEDMMYGGFRGAGTVAAPSEDQFRDFCRGLGKETVVLWYIVHMCISYVTY